MVQPGQNPRDSIYDPYSYQMFGTQYPPFQPPQNNYSMYGWSPYGGTPEPVPQKPLFQPLLDQNGHFDVGKVVNGATQLASVINQTAPAIKQLSPLLKFFRR